MAAGDLSDDLISTSLPFDAEDMLAACEKGRVVHTRLDINGDAERAALEFTWNDVMQLARSDRHAAQQWRLYKNGQAIDLALMGVLGEQGRLRQDRLEPLLEQGVSVMINRLELKLPSVRQLARQIELSTGAYVRVVAIGSPGRAPCMPLHYDHVDVIAVQTAGEKTWLFYGSPIPGCGVVRRLPTQPTEKTDEKTLRVGDFLFVPAGLHHQCQPSENSLHLAFNLKWPTLKELAPALMENYPEELSLLEPIRSFRQPERIDTLQKQLAAHEECTLTRQQVVDFFDRWPQACARRYRVSDLGEFY